MEFWVARDKDNSLRIYDGQPERGEFRWKKSPFSIIDCFRIDSSMFPEVTWESGPVKVELRTRKEKALWLARDDDNALYLYEDKPVMPDVEDCDRGCFMPSPEGRVIEELPSDFFPEVRWENSPVEVEFKIKKK